MIPARRRWLAGALLVGLGWLASPDAVPVYDGVDKPDEPYRYVAPPAGATRTAEPTSTSVVMPVKDGVNATGLTVSTAEDGPQFSVYLPMGALAAKGTGITVTVTPQAPTDGPAGEVPDGNLYRLELEDPAGPVTVTPKAAIATLYLRATSQKRPQPDMWFRPVGGAWRAVDTTAGGFDVRVASFAGAGDYLVARREGLDAGGGGVPTAPLVVVVVLVALVGVVLVVRLRSQPSE